MRESLRRIESSESSESSVGLSSLPNPDASGVTDALLILRELNPSLSLCRDTCVWVSAGALDPTPTHFIKLQLDPNTDVFCKYAFFKNGVKVCDDS